LSATRAVAGLTLGGGIGRLQRRFGLTIDSLRAVELVSADGRIVRATAEEGAGAVLGPARGSVRTSASRRASSSSSTRSPAPCTAACIFHAATNIHELWATFRNWATAAPDTISAIFTVALAEPAADYPDEVAGRPIVVISYNHSGAGEDVERDVAPLLRGPRPAKATAVSERYVDVQRSSDLSLAWGRVTFILGGNIADCSPAVLDAFRSARRARARREQRLSITAMGGAIGHVPDDAMAYSGRTSPFDVARTPRGPIPPSTTRTPNGRAGAMAIVRDELLRAATSTSSPNRAPRSRAASYGDAKLDRLRA
jgi:hypothetical protein